MTAYYYNESILCQACGEYIQERLRKPYFMQNMMDPDKYPQELSKPYPVDICDDCHQPLEEPR